MSMERQDVRWHLRAVDDTVPVFVHSAEHGYFKIMKYVEPEGNRAVVFEVESLGHDFALPTEEETDE